MTISERYAAATIPCLPDQPVLYGVFDWERCRWVTELVEVGQLGIIDLPEGTVKRVTQTWLTEADATYRAAELNARASA